MKALILKDLFVLWKQMRYFLVILLVIGASEGIFGGVFIVIWAAMLPYTAYAYDERSKWDQLAAMLPYSKQELVMSKYVLGWLLSGVAVVFSLMIQALVNVTGLYENTGDLFSTLLGFCGSLCVLSITMPMMFRFGVEKGRLVMFMIIFLVCIGGGAFASVAVTAGGGGLALPGPALALLPIASVVLTAVSIPLSMRLYQAGGRA